jgi:hypothetical protein
VPALPQGQVDGGGARVGDQTPAAGGWGRLSRPGLRPSSPRALPAPIIRRRSEAFDLPIAGEARYVRLDRERSGPQRGSAPMRIGRT